MSKLTIFGIEISYLQLLHFHHFVINVETFLFSIKQKKMLKIAYSF